MNSVICKLEAKKIINNEIFILELSWNTPAVKAGQFFMLKPERSCVFLPRPISVFEYNSEQKKVKFLIVRAGKGTEEFFNMHPGEKMRLTGPLGNTWAEFLPENGKAALVSGSAGVAPLAALVAEKPDYNFHLYSGFKKGFRSKEEENAVLGCAKNARKLIVAAEDGVNAHNGSILDYFFDPGNYDVIFACGSAAMLKAVKEKCKSFSTPCFISMESKMACGTGACLGCTVRTVNANVRCCSEGPIFSASEVIFNE